MRKTILSLTALLCLSASLHGQQQTQTPPSPSIPVENDSWKIAYNDTGITSLTSKSDPYDANLLNGELGDVMLNYRVEDGVWMRMRSNQRKADWNPSTQTLTYVDAGPHNSITMTQKFSLEGDKLHWGIELENHSQFPIQIGDLAPYIPWTSGGRTQKQIFEGGFTKHASIAGDGSFLYFTKLGGMAPHYLLTVDPGTKLEYFANVPQPQQRGQAAGNRYRVFVYSKHINTPNGHTGQEWEGTWRQPITEGWLKPAGQQGSKMTFGFTYSTASSYPDLRDKIYEAGLIDTRVVPGLTLPVSQKGRFALRSKGRIEAVTAEFPASTKIQYIGESEKDTHIYEVSFSRLGENMITITFDGGRKTYLEYFSSESPETIMKKRASFLVNKQQFRNTGKWYEGLYGIYDMKEGELLGPDNPGFFDEYLTYFLASDDPSLGKAPYLASKNVVFPDDKEIESLEYHLEHFVWGGLQRTDKETPYEYGIYGIPDWNVNRNTALHDTQSNVDNEKHMWRTYDYAHLIMLWWHMYQIATLYPEKVNFMTAEEYLNNAYNTCRVYYLYPVELRGDYYEPFKWGCYNELVIPQLIDELDRLGQKDKADVLRLGWEKKAKYFIYDDTYPYQSEYAMDRTAFESSYALAKYGVQNDMKPDENLWYDRNAEVWRSHPVVTKEAARKFMDHQHFANLSCRGYLETQWSIMGGDFARSSDNSTHSYMARMGGWSVLDYGYRFAEDPYEWLALGYASHYNPMGTMNTGTAESNYGFWYPGKENDGALGQAYTNLKYGHPWIQTDEVRGPWRFCGEGDLGMCAFTRTAVTILANDPVFGWTLYGGNIDEASDKFTIWPDDGARVRFWMVNDENRVGVELNRDNFSMDKPMIVSKNRKEMEINIENTVGGSHTTTVKVELQGAQRPTLNYKGRNISSKKDRYGAWLFDIPVDSGMNTAKLTWR
jgi:hypothetical protein